MAGATGDALEWAVALLQAPGQQRALRTQPLPPGMDRLLAMASGASPDQLLGASRAFGESAQRIQEAARFYVRQILFHPEADAYRVLGVAADASPAQIKTHYRLLQLWLHPDRLESRDDAVFATRVNQAWQQLRSPERRAAYDEGRNGARQIPAAVPMAPAAASWLPEPLPEPAGERWRRRAPVLALLAACGVLTVMALRDNGPHAGDPVPQASAHAQAPAPRLPAWEAALAASPARQPAASLPAAEARKRPTPTDPAGTLLPAAFAPARSLPDAGLSTGAPPSEPLPASAGAPPPVLAAPHAPARQRALRPRGDAVKEPPVAPAASAAAALETLPDFGRLEAAQGTGRKLLRYLQSRRSPAPPIWTSPALLMQAQALRATLLQGPAIRMGVPQWRIASGEAEMRVRVARKDAGSDQLVAELAWREERWLVTGLRLEPLS